MPSHSLPSRAFQPVLLHPSTKAIDNYSVPKIALRDHVAIIDDIEVCRSHVDVENRLVRWTRPIGPDLHEHGCFKLFSHHLSGQGVILISSNQNLDHVPNHDELITFRARSSAADAGADIYEISTNLAVWAKGDKAPPPASTDPSFGKLEFATIDVGGATGMSLPTMRMSMLDDLCTSINKTYGQQYQLQSLYESSVNLAGSSPNDGTSSSIVLTEATLLLHLADDPTARTNLTFKKNLSSEIVLPVLFQELNISKLMVGGQVALQGALYEFDSSMRGSLGNRHFIYSTKRDNSMLAGSQVALQRNGLNSDQVSPAPVTEQMALNNLGSLQDLIMLPGYADIAIQNKAQEYVQGCLLYQCQNDGLISDILKGQSIPKDLPHALSDQMDTNLAKFVQNIYAPAYVSNMLIHCDLDKTTAWRASISPVMEDRIRYWFSGQGPTCLSSQYAYNTITGIATRAALLNSMPGLSNYTQVWQTWVDPLASCLSEPALIRSLLRTPMAKNVNYPNKVSNILHMLDQEKKYSSALFTNVIGHIMSATVNTPYLNLNSTESTDTVTQDALSHLQALMSMVFDNNSSQYSQVSSSARLELTTEVTKLEKAYGLNSSASAPVRATNLWNKEVDLFTAFFTSLSPVTNTSSLLESTPSQIWDAGLQGVTNAYDIVFKRIYPNGSVNAAGTKGLMCIVSLGYLISKGSQAFSQWDGSSDVTKSLLIENTMAAAVRITTDSLDAYKAIQTMDSEILPRVFAARTLDEGTRTELILLARKLQSTPLSELEADGWEARVVQKVFGRGIPRLPVASGDASLVLEWTQPIIDDIKTTTTAMEDVAKTFNTAEHWLGGAAVLLSIAIVISSSISLADNWDSDTEAQKALNIISIVVTGLSVVMNDFVAEAFIASVEAFDIAMDTTLATTLPLIGLGLAVIGTLVSVLLIVFDTPKAPPPPSASPTEQFVNQKLPPMVNQWHDQPKPILTYTLDQTVVSGKQILYTITAVNKSSTTSRFAFDKVRFTFKCGNQDSSLFSTVPLKMTTSTDPRVQKALGNVFLTGYQQYYDLVGTLVQNKRGDNTIIYDLEITGVSTQYNPAGKVNIGPGGKFVVTISAVAASGITTEMLITERQILPARTDSSFVSVLVKKTTS